MINNIEKNVKTTLKNFPKDNTIIASYEDATQRFNKMVSCGITQHRGNRTSPQSQFSKELISFNRSTY